MLGPSKQPNRVRYTGCTSQSSPQGWSQSPSTALPAWRSYQKIPDASSAVLTLVCPERNIRCTYTYGSPLAHAYWQYSVVTGPQPSHLPSC